MQLRLANEVYTYSGRQSLTVRYSAAHRNGKRCAAIVLVHGGGWFEGDASWVDHAARRFNAMGLVTLAINYRLYSATNGITPLDSIRDVKAAISWVKSHYTRLNVYPDRIAVYGESAGGHLAAESFLWGGLPRPQALLLLSPNLSVTHSRWFRRMTYPRLDPKALSPLDNVRAGVCPTFIAHGTADTRASYQAAVDFQTKMRELGNECVLNTFSGYGHLLAGPGKDDRKGYMDAKAANEAFANMESFLRARLL